MSTLNLKCSKVIAMLLAVVMLISMIPISSLSVFAVSTEYFTVTVTDLETGAPIADAEVRLTTPNPTWTITAEPVFTDENGRANFDTTIIADALTAAGIDGSALLTVIVDKSGYEYNSDIQEIRADNLTVGRNVSLEKQKVTITGTVTNENGLAYEGATVKITGAIEAQTTTDAAGNYSLQAYKGFGEYTITATASEEKYLPASTTVSAPAEDLTCAPLQFELKQITVSTVAGDNGTITESAAVPYGSNTEVTAAADEFYRIQSFEVDGTPVADAVGKKTYTHPIENITSAKSVHVTFERYSYKISFTVSENGSVTYNDGTEQTVAGGSVSIDKEVAIENGTIEVNASPADNYRVSKVVVDGNAQSFTENGQEYTQEFDINKDHTFEVEFEINTFTVEIENGENGTSAADKEVVEYNGSATITITPNPGYNIDTVKINGTESTDYTINDDKSSYALKINCITENTKVDITYSSIPSIPFDEGVALNTADILKPVDGEDVTTYIYAKDGKAVFTTAKKGIRVNGVKTGNSFETQTLEITESTSITKIEVFDGKKWENVTLEKGIQIVIDTTAPVVEPDSAKLSWTKSDTATISGSVTDADPKNPSSGFAYIVWSKDNELKAEDVLKADKNKIALGADGKFSFMSEPGEQQSYYYIYAVDISGNVSAAGTVKVQIDKTAPTVTGFTFEKIQNPAFAEAISFISFGTFFPESINVTISVADTGSSIVNSGAKEIQLYANGKEVGAPIEVVSGSATFELSQEKFADAVISAKVIDQAGNESKITTPTDKNVTTNAASNRVCINDAAAGSIELEIGSSVKEESNNVKYLASDKTEWYANENVTLNLKLRDEVVGLKKIQVTVNGTDLTDTTDPDKFDLSLVMTTEKILNLDIAKYLAEGKYTVEVTVTNNANISKTVPYTFHIDKTAPGISQFEFEHKGDTPLEKTLNFLTFGMFFDDKVEVTVTASDSDPSSSDSKPSSGVKTITLYVGSEAFETKEAADDKATFVIPAKEIADNIKRFDEVISAKAVDFVGNETENFVEPGELNSDAQNSRLVIETVKPNISISCPDAAQNKNLSTDDKNDWYNDDVEFTVDVADTDSGIRSVNISINGTVLVDDKDLYTAEIHSKQYKVKTSDTRVIRNSDGSYTINVVVTDNAGNVNDASKTIYKDIDKPDIAGFDFEPENYIEGKETESSVEVTDYGFYFKADTKVTISAKDSAPSAGVKSITYYTVDKDTGKSAETTAAVDEDGQIEFTVKANFKGQIYAKATDNVDNVADQFVNPNSVIVEDEAKHQEESHIFFEKDNAAYTANNNTELYAKDVPVKLTVIDTYSGIRSITWSVSAPYDNGNNQSGEVIVNNDKSFTAESDQDWKKVEEERNLVTKMEKDIVVRNNSNNIIVKVTMVDRAGNTSEEEIKFSIDKTIPTIDVVYDNNTPDTEYKDIYKADREATITITERNFRAEDVVFAITNTDKVIPAVDLTKANVWNTTENKEDPDKTVHVAKIKYTADGDYTFDISYKDNADNAAKPFAQHKFTIDKTIPVVAVSYNNNSARNGNYYNADRIATITITEHNFDAKRVRILEATPAISAWRSEGDTHTATIAYNTDGKYTLDIEFMDMAGNSIRDFAAQEFYIDKTNPTVAISGIVDQSANNGDGNIGFSITATDVNFDGFVPVLSAVVMKDGAFESTNVTTGSTADITNGQVYTVTNIDTDGIYSITCTVVDKAGNAYSEVILEDASGKTYVEKRSGSDKLVTFSVNRNGSVFMLDSYTNDLVKTNYVTNITQNATIIEINADPIVENTVTLNGKTLVENTDYTVNLDNSAGSWYKYSYSLNKSLFDGESEYSIVVSSKDKATNKAFSDVKDVAVKFVVDRTAPIVTVAGLKANGRYQVDRQVVTLVPTDDGGLLKTLIVRALDDNGNPIKELLNLSGDALSEAVANGNITFELGEGLYQNVQILCEDFAGNISGAEAEDIFSNVSISSSAFMIFWANKPLRWGSIAGVVLLAAVIIFLIASKKRKKEK